MFVVRDVHRQLMHDWRMKMTSEAVKHPNLMNCFTKPRYYCALFTALSLVALIIFSFSHSRDNNYVNQNLPKEVFEPPRESLHRTFVVAPTNPMEPDVAVNTVNPTVPIPAPIPAPIQLPTITEQRDPQIPDVPAPRDPQLIPIQQVQPVSQDAGIKPNMILQQRTTVAEAQAIAPNIVEAVGIPPPQVAPPQVVPPQVAPIEKTNSTIVLVNAQKQNPDVDDDKVWKYMFNIWKQAALAQAHKNQPFL